MKSHIPSFFFLLFASSLLLFSFWLMFHTFNSGKGYLLISSKVWSDFAASIPLIRSFSFGSNFPLEYPLFPGEPIRYHFLFFAFVGLLERAGVPLSLALNIPSALGFFALLIMIYLLGKTIFKKQSVGALAVVLFLFNGSLSFLEFFKKYPLNKETLDQIVTNPVFPSFGPYDGKVVSAFWNLNIYTNQRHLGLSFALFLLTIYILLRLRSSNKKNTLAPGLFIGIISGFLPFLHKVVFGLSIASIFYFFLFFKNLRKLALISLVIALFISVPQLLTTRGFGENIELYPNYLIEGKLTVESFLAYWFQNLGLYLTFIPAAFALSNRQQRKILLLFAVFFLIGHLFKFSPEVAANHKFFNLFLIGGNIFVAFVLVKIWQRKLFGKILALFSIFFLTFSGIIDFFPIVNDTRGKIEDYLKNDGVVWIRENTSKSSVFLNNSYLYHPASLAGRKIFLGWPYFSWSQGHNTQDRFDKMVSIFSQNRKTELCEILLKHNLAFAAFDYDSQEFRLDRNFWKENFISAYYNPSRNFEIYNINSSCKGRS